ncbi:ymr244c-a-like protein [Lentinula edodes]|uniref:Ymr244c-a-like protein n=1 Tax=Lentinula edodes TaxID=5353 RepID=A0A1Q3E3M8_LENED|nr:ymr244c-a-like protein [Lentinula edodes]
MCKSLFPFKLTCTWPLRSSQKDTGSSTREDRKQCWETRGQYFACLDSVGILKPGDEKTSVACSSKNKAYKQKCAKSWIEYFNQRRSCPRIRTYFTVMMVVVNILLYFPPKNAYSNCGGRRTFRTVDTALFTVICIIIVVHQCFTSNQEILSFLQ